MTTKSDQALCQRLPSPLQLNGYKCQNLGRDSTGNSSPYFNITAETVQLLTQRAKNQYALKRRDLSYSTQEPNSSVLWRCWGSFPILLLHSSHWEPYLDMALHFLLLILQYLVSFLLFLNPGLQIMENFFQLLLFGSQASPHLLSLCKELCLSLELLCKDVLLLQNLQIQKAVKL